MPTYQYRCHDCDEPLEVKQSFSDPALTECPACGGRLRKIFGTAGVVFKGSGFYRTDSRQGPKAGSATGSGSGSDSGSSAGSGTSSSGTSQASSAGASTSSS